MIELMLFAIILYGLGSVAYYFVKKTKADSKLDSQNKPKHERASIVGMSHTKVGQYARGIVSEKDKRQLVSPEEMEETFYTQEEAQLDIDIDIEGAGAEEDNEFLAFECDSDMSLAFAAGANFDELFEVSGVIQEHLEELSQKQLTRTAQTIREIEHTKILNVLENQVENGKQKIADILDRCEAELRQGTKTEQNNTNAQSFNLDKWV